MAPHRPLPVNLRQNPNLGDAEYDRIMSVLSGLPALAGSPIDVRVLPKLRAYRGKLLSGRPSFGIPVHAASFIRRREIVLETELLRKRGELRLIVVHEIFHFVWARLGHRDRAAYAALLEAEVGRGARGELGESSDRQKSLWQAHKSNASWKFYVCESFCDTAAWLYADVERYREFTLAARWRNPRRLWFEHCFAGVRSC